MLKVHEELKNSGPLVREPYSKYLGDRIYEARSQIGNNIDRMLYFFDKDKIIIISNGFTKKTNKTPKQELDLATKYRNEYFTRKQNGRFRKVSTRTIKEP